MEKAELLSKVVILTSDLYHNGELTKAQKGLLETIIGAGIFYLPKKSLYSGYISKAALIQLETDPQNTKLVEEHSFPRKIAGKKLYTDFLQEIKENPDGLKELYINRLGRYNLVLKSENDGLKKWQKDGTFIDEETAYKEAKIELVPFPNEKYKAFNKYKNALKNKKGKEVSFSIHEEINNVINILIPKKEDKIS